MLHLCPQAREADACKMPRRELMKQRAFGNLGIAKRPDCRRREPNLPKY